MSELYERLITSVEEAKRKREETYNERLQEVYDKLKSELLRAAEGGFNSYVYTFRDYYPENYDVFHNVIKMLEAETPELSISKHISGWIGEQGYTISWE